MAVQAGLAKYVKRKRMDRVDTYLPPLLQARDQLVRIGRVMRECAPALLPAAPVLLGPAFIPRRRVATAAASAEAGPVA